MIPLQVSVRDGEIIDVGPFRHRVRWDEGGESAITYCNACGSSLILENDAGQVCADCGGSQH